MLQCVSHGVSDRDQSNIMNLYHSVVSVLQRVLQCVLQHVLQCVLYGVSHRKQSNIISLYRSVLHTASLSLSLTLSVGGSPLTIECPTVETRHVHKNAMIATHGNTNF